MGRKNLAALLLRKPIEDHHVHPTDKRAVGQQSIVTAIDQHVANAGFAHLAEGDFLGPLTARDPADQVGREAARCWSLRGQAGLNRASRSLGLEKIMLLGEHQPKQGDGEQQGQKHKRDDHHRQDSVQRHRAPCYPTRYLREEKFGPNFGPKLKSTGRYELI